MIISPQIRAQLDSRHLTSHRRCSNLGCAGAGRFTPVLSMHLMDEPAQKQPLQIMIDAFLCEPCSQEVTREEFIERTSGWLTDATEASGQPPPDFATFEFCMAVPGRAAN